MLLAVELELDVLVFHQREQRFLRDDAAHVRLRADIRANLVHFVDEDDAVAHRSQRIADAARGRIRVETSENCFAVSAMFVGENVGVDADDIRIAKVRTRGDELFDGAHQRRLARSRISDQQNVRRRLADEMFDDGDRDLAQHVVLSENGPAQFLEDVARTEGEGGHCGADYR